MTTAREKAIETFWSTLGAPAVTPNLPRAAFAVLVNELIAALDEEHRQTLEELTNARLAHDEQIGKLIAIVKLQSIDARQQADGVIAELEALRHG